MTPHAKEALRQQMLLRALWHDARSAVVGGWLRDGPKLARGLQAYQANAGALAERALGAAYPTVAALVGGESFAALARAFWHADAPQRGDVAAWGEGLAAFIAADAQLADEPYLADVSRVDWAVHQAERAADGAPPQGLDALADAEHRVLRLAPGVALVPSAHPVVAIWHAHRRDDGDRFAPVRAAFAEGRGEHALVFRSGWRGDVRVAPAPESRFVAALLQHRPLGDALAAAGAGFDFTAWLVAALQAGLVAGLEEPSR